jgi:hypothetical protein
VGRRRIEGETAELQGLRNRPERSCHLAEFYRLTRVQDPIDRSKLWSRVPMTDAIREHLLPRYEGDGLQPESKRGRSGGGDTNGDRKAKDELLEDHQ